MDIYQEKRINHNFIILCEYLSEKTSNVMALFIGEKKAALIDAGMGVTGDLDKYVMQFTDLPITVLCTHGDPDHVGSCILFDDVYMSDLDDEIMPYALSLKNRLSDLVVMSNGNKTLCDYAQTHIVGEQRFKYKNIKDGDSFDLGGIVLEAVAVPGHSKGCICFINRADKIAITGDAIISTPWLWLDRCTPISTYIEGVMHFKKIVSNDYKIYCGHSMDPLPEGIIDDIIQAGAEITEGKNTENDMPFIVPYNIDTSNMKVMQHHYGNAHLIYNKNRHGK